MTVGDRPLFSNALTARLLSTTTVFIGLMAGGAQAQTDTSDAKSPPEKQSAIETVVVQAQRATQTIARKAQEEAPNLINLLTYQDIRKLPDVTVAESVRRVPGVSMETDEGEGRYVNIRGFDADLNSVTFGGLRLPPTNNASPFGGYRAVALDSIPAGLVGAIIVTKSNLPSQDAEDLGGTIEITPRTAPPGTAPFAEGHLGSGYEPLRRRGIYDFSLTAGARFGGTGDSEFFGDGPFSILVTATYYDDQRGINDVEPGYFNDGVRPYFAFNNMQQRDYELHRRRHAFGIDLGYQPNDSNSYYVRAFDAGYTELYKRQFLNLSPDGNAVLLPDGSIQDTLNGATAIQKALRYEQETSISRVVTAGGKNTFGDAVLDYRLGYIVGTYVKPFDYNLAFDFQPTSPNATITYSPNGLGNTPAYSIAGADYLNPANYVLDPNAVNSTARNFDREWSAATNLEIATDWLGGDSESLKFGASARLRHKKQSAQPTSYPTLPAAPLTSAISGDTGEVYYSGQYQNGIDIVPTWFQSQFGTGVIQPGDAISAESQFLDAKEDVLAGYGMYNYNLGHLGIVAGVRVEHTKDTMHAFETTGNAPVGTPGCPAGGLCATPVTAGANYTDVFPSAQARYEIEPDFIARATYSSTLARPGFNQITPATTFDYGTPAVTVGNPNLRPATANSFDLSFEKYLGEGGILSLGVFDKQISNYILPNTVTGAHAPSFLHFPDPVLLISFSNAPPSYARGLEFNWEERFTQLPGLLSGLGAGFNFTYVDSSVEIRPGDHSLLPSTSKRTWNATLFYERGPVSVRLAAYSVSADLFGIGSDPTSDIYNASRTSMDFGSNYMFCDNVGFYFNVKNLLNTPHAFYEGSPNRPIQREFYGQTYQFGIKFDF